MTLECLAKIEGTQSWKSVGLARCMSRSKDLLHLMNPSLIPRAHSERQLIFRSPPTSTVVAHAHVYTTPKLACESPALFLRRYKLTKENDPLGSTSGYG